MRLRVLAAPRMADAMARLRAELGPDAVILSSRRTATGVEVTAALDAPPGSDDDRAAPDADEPVLIPPLAPLPTAAAPAHAAGGEPAAADPFARHGVPAALAARLRGGGRRPLAPALAAALRFSPDPLPDAAGPEPVLAFVGPAGAGKTLTAAKLAARLVVAGRAPLVVTADAARAGAAEQLAAFTRVLGLTLAVAATPAQVARAMARRAPGQPALLDTAACDPFDPAQAAALLATLRAASAEPVLALPAGLDPCEAAETARAYAALGARRMIPTRLDAARRLGSVLAAAEAGPLALCEAGTGPGVADGLTTLTPDWLAARLLAAPSRPPMTPQQQEAAA